MERGREGNVGGGIIAWGSHRGRFFGKDWIKRKERHACTPLEC